MIRPSGQLDSELKLSFHSPALLEQALTHRSAASVHNERLEFLGDSIVNFVIAEALYQQFPSADEGQLSRLRARLVCQRGLAKVAKELELGAYIRLGSGELKSGGARRESILADVLEALIGALYLDQGLRGCQQHILPWFASQLMALSLENCQKDAKTRLQERLQAKQLALPNYEVVETSGQAHEQTFKIQLKVEDFPIVEASASSKRRAEQKAAELFLSQWPQDKT